jgi:hypothetical protein
VLKETAMWKLFAMVLIVSDTGSIATSQIATDFATPEACQQAALELFPKRAEHDENGHHVVIRSATDCRFDGSGPPLPPPPLARLPGPFFYNR